jgi:hypothetical protein
MTMAADACSQTSPHAGSGPAGDTYLAQHRSQPVRLLEALNSRSRCPLRGGAGTDPPAGLEQIRRTLYGPARLSTHLLPNGGGVTGRRRRLRPGPSPPARRRPPGVGSRCRCPLIRQVTGAGGRPRSSSVTSSVKPLTSRAGSPGSPTCPPRPRQLSPPARPATRAIRPGCSRRQCLPRPGPPHRASAPGPSKTSADAQPAAARLTPLDHGDSSCAPVQVTAAATIGVTAELVAAIPLLNTSTTPISPWSGRPSA